MIVVTGAAHLVLRDGARGRCDSTPWLRERKTRKFMGVQDELAVVCAGGALTAAALSKPLGSHIGLYIAVGYIPFEERDARPVLEASLDAADGFDMTRFAAGGWQKAHPLVTFRCLPNMPAYHVSANFGMEGPYLVTYPGPGQMYLGLEEACTALENGEVRVALCGGVADQRNFLVEHHHARLIPPIAANRLCDAAGFLVLEREQDARERGAAVLARLDALQIGYEPFDPLAELTSARSEQDLVLGPAAPLIAVSEKVEQASTDHASWRMQHVQHTIDGYRCTATWSAP